jgi:uncharacterized membrane protein
MHPALRLLYIAVIMVAIDTPWLLANKHIPGGATDVMHAVQGGRPMIFRYGAAVPVYLAMAYLLTKARSAWEAAAIGAAAYAVYDFTNYALFKDYTLTFALMDTAWGGILFAVAYLLTRGRIQA